MVVKDMDDMLLVGVFVIKDFFINFLCVVSVLFIINKIYVGMDEVY